jgi:iron complex outermembrane receptor protein
MKKLFFILLMFSAGIILAQKVIIRGTVTDEIQQPVSKCVVKILPGDIILSTDSEGKFSSAVQPGKYSLLFMHKDYQVQRIVVRVSQKTNLNIVLKPKSEKLDEVIISAVKATDDMPVTQTNITRKQIQEQNLGQDVPYLIEMTPSVVATSDAGAGIGYTGIRIRGIGSQQINVTLNGIPLNDPESQSVYWVDIPDFAANTQSLQIQRGVGTSGFGTGAFGAAVNLASDRISPVPYLQLQSSYGSFNTLKYSAKASTGLWKDHFELSGRFSKINSDGYIDRASSDLQSYYISGAYQDDKNTLKAIVFGGHEITYQAWYGVDKETLETNPTFNYAGAIYNNNWEVTDYYDNQVDDYKQDHYQLHYKHNFSEKLYINTAVHYTYGRGFYEQYKQGQDYSEYGLNPLQAGNEADLVRQKWLDNDFYGWLGALHYQNSKYKMILGLAANEYDGRHFGQVIRTYQEITNPLPKEYYRNTGIKKSMSGFVKNIYQVNSKLKLYADLQIRKINYSANGILDDKTPVDLSDDLLFINPKIGLTYQINPRQKSYLSLAQTHREPNRDDYINALGDKKPEPETLNNIEAGWQYNDEKWLISHNIYGMFYSNQLVLTGKLDNVGNPIRENVGKSYRAGIESQIGYRINSKFDINLNFTLSDNRNIDYIKKENGELHHYGNTALTYSPNIIAGGTITYKVLKNLKLQFISKYIGKQYMDNRNISASVLPEYFIENVFVAYRYNISKVLKNLDFSLKINNILNRKYVSNGYMWGDTPYYFPQAGRNFLLGVQARF